MAIEIIGIAHVIVTLQELDKIREFYCGLTKAFWMECLVDTDKMFYAVGSRTGLGARQGRRDMPYHQYNAGVHHLCFRARNEESIEEVTQLVERLGGAIIHGP